MRPTPESDAVFRPVLYAGRFADRLPDAAGGHVVLDDWDVLPGQLAAATKDASVLVVLDLLSFPFETLAGAARNIPLVLVMPDFDVGFLSAVFGEMVFEDLCFFDRLATPDAAMWEDLRRRYSWAEGQRVALGGDASEAAAGILALLEDGTIPSGDGRGARAEPRYEKAVHRAQAAALLPQFAAARGARDEDMPLDVLEVGAGDGRWATGFDLPRTRFHGLDASDDTVAAARAGFPEGSFGRLGPGLVLPHDDEAFDLVFCVDVMRRYPVSDKLTLLSEMWRAARPGGRLLFLEDFVFGAEARSEGLYPTSVNEFVGLLLEATAGQVVLEHVESIRYPGEDSVRGGVIAVSRLGVPKRW